MNRFHLFLVVWLTIGITQWFPSNANADFLTIDEFNSNDIALTAVTSATRPTLSETAFADLVQSEFSNDQAGVVTFENSSGSLATNSGIVDAVFGGTLASPTKTLRFEQVVSSSGFFANSDFTNGLGSFSGNEASGTLGLQITNNVDVGLSLSGSGISANERVTHLGFVLDRVTGNGLPRGFIGARFSDGTSFLQSITYRNGFNPEFFISIVAPENQGIESLQLGFDDTTVTPQFGTIDDLSFVTATAVPEPSTALTFAAFGLIATSFRRRRVRRA